jgi:hypothetical protein
LPRYASCRFRVTETMERILPKSEFGEKKLFDAMRYGFLTGEKGCARFWF